MLLRCFCCHVAMLLFQNVKPLLKADISIIAFACCSWLIYYNFYPISFKHTSYESSVFRDSNDTNTSNLNFAPKCMVLPEPVTYALMRSSRGLCTSHFQPPWLDSTSKNLINLKKIADFKGSLGSKSLSQDTEQIFLCCKIALVNCEKITATCKMSQTFEDSLFGTCRLFTLVKSPENYGWHFHTWIALPTACPSKWASPGNSHLCSGVGVSGKTPGSNG